MSITLEKYELANMLRDAGEYAVKQYRIERGEEKPFISQSEAYRLFGEGVVKRWVKEGLIKRKKDGDNTSTVRYDRLGLEVLAKSNNRLTYLDSEERKQKQLDKVVAAKNSIKSIELENKRRIKKIARDEKIKEIEDLRQLKKMAKEKKIKEKEKSLKRSK